MPESAVFDALAREFFAVWFRYHPEAALAAGVGDYGSLPAPQSDDDHAALGGWLETLIVGLEELDHGALDPARRLDAELLFALAAVEHRTLLERDWRRRDPLRFLPLGELHRLTLLRPASLRDDLLALLLAIPAHLRLAMTQLTPMAELIPPPLVQAAIAVADAGPAYLRTLTRSRWLRMHCHGSGELESAAETAATALRHYVDSLGDTIAPRAAGPCGCGAGHLGFLLRHRHRLPIAPEACDGLLARLADTLDAAIADQAVTDPSVPRDRIGAECARQSELLRSAGIMTLPAAPLRVTGGPARPRPGTAADTVGWPPPGEDGAGIDYVPDLVNGRGTLYVADTLAEAEPAPSMMAGPCCTGLGWGGLHTLTFAGGMAARSLPRLLSGAVSLTRGWPLSLLGQAPLAGDGAVCRLRHRAVTEARLELDLHLGRVDLAVARGRAAALGDPDRILAALIRSPGDALAAVLGWQLIDAARRWTVPEGGAAALRRFHDGLLTRGPIPASAALAADLGEETVSALLTGLSDSGDATA